MQKLILRHGDCVDVLKDYEDESIGAFCCDPPYHISFMGKSWDAEEAGIAFSARLWDEVYRVLRPGGMVKAFSGTRTFHRMVAAMQEAGFRDLRLEVWSYGSGFPKSLNVGKALDKAAGVGPSRITENLTGSLGGFGDAGWNTTPRQLHYDDPTTTDAKKWEGWGTALKPSWEPVCVARKVGG